MQRAAVFCSHGLGDGLLFLVVAHNLFLNGWEATTFHNELPQLQSWFPSLALQPFPREEELASCLSSFDLIVVNGDHLPLNLAIRGYAQKHFPDKLWVLFPTTCKGKNLPGDFHFSPQISMVQNLVSFCQKDLALQSLSPSIGITPPFSSRFRHYSRRVVLHPTSKNPAKNWPKDKFRKLALALQKKGFEIAFALSPKEREEWLWARQEGMDLPLTPSLSDLALYLYESGYFVGNASGVGHLASALGIPVLSIFASPRKQEFWRPDWSLSHSVSCWRSIPNWKSFRFRDKYWATFISTSKVQKKILSLIDLFHN